MTDLQFLLAADAATLTVAIAGYRARTRIAIRWRAHRTIRQAEAYLRHPANQPREEKP